MSNPSIDKRYSGLRKIYKQLAEAGYYEHGHILNYDEISNDLSAINLLVHKTYLILKKPSSKQDKIKELTSLIDPTGKPLVNEAVAQLIVERHGKKIVEFYDNIYDSVSQLNQKGGYNREKYFEDNIVANTAEDAKDAVIENLSNAAGNVKHKVVELGDNVKTKITDGFQKSYVGKKINKKYTDARDIVKDIYKSPLLTKLENFLQIDDFLDVVGKLQAKIGFPKFVKDLRIPTILINAVKFGILKGPFIVYRVSNYIFNWVFFPLYMLENLPLVGLFFEIPLDIIAFIIDNSDVFIQPMVNILPLGMDAMLKVAGVVPGLGAAVNAAKIPLALIRTPMEYFMENGSDIIGMFLNIERKQFGLAYISALEIFPALPPLMDTVMTNLYLVNKWTGRGASFTEFISDMANATDIISEPYIMDPTVIVRPKYVWDEVIYPNKEDIPLVRSLPIDEISTVVNVVKSTAVVTYNDINSFIKQFI